MGLYLRRLANLTGVQPSRENTQLVKHSTSASIALDTFVEPAI
jgi:hypothetical protein